ncbi:SDR family oxidoreductase [Nonomuraea phyllanthi]|uniref:hypothetical protein n=1 Tax=Nonomuraea phyllanthi TaxID=2219224 RepID=UPI001D002E1D|nr:hypothetical protein [Nonomuraea phyllanthi]
MTIEHDTLAGLRVLVTGGSRGLGEATARRFAAAPMPTLASSSSEGAVDHLRHMADSQGVGVDEAKQQIVDHLNVPRTRFEE